MRASYSAHPYIFYLFTLNIIVSRAPQIYLASDCVVLIILRYFSFLILGNAFIFPVLFWLGTFIDKANIIRLIYVLRFGRYKLYSDERNDYLSFGDLSICQLCWGSIGGAVAHFDVLVLMSLLSVVMQLWLLRAAVVICRHGVSKRRMLELQWATIFDCGALQREADALTR